MNQLDLRYDEPLQLLYPDYEQMIWEQTVEQVDGRVIKIVYPTMPRTTRDVGGVIRGAAYETAKHWRVR